jgi:hypothetical protein
MFSLFIGMSLVASDSKAQNFSSAYSCFATTPCLDYNGYIVGQISCEVYGHQYVSGYGVASNASCTWGVVPYQSVQCTGFQQVQNQYGQYVWAWQNYSFSCY